MIPTAEIDRDGLQSHVGFDERRDAAQGTQTTSRWYTPLYCADVRRKSGDFALDGLDGRERGARRDRRRIGADMHGLEDLEPVGIAEDREARESLLATAMAPR